MAKPISEKLAEALEAAIDVAKDHIVQSCDLKETQLTLLTSGGFLKRIIKCWYLLEADVSSRGLGTSALWHESYWSFVAQYLTHELGTDYCVSPEQSLDILTGHTASPKQLLIGNIRGANRVVALPREMSLSLYSVKQLPENPIEHEGVRLYPLERALVKAGPSYFRKQPQEIALALKQASLRDLVEILLNEGNVAAAGRLAGACRAVGLKTEARNILEAMKTAGYRVAEQDPFAVPVPNITALRPKSPHAARLELLWQSLAPRISEQLSEPPGRYVDIEKALKRVEEIYTHDAYHSLSIEGYKVTPELVERVRNGEWDPAENDGDRQQLDAMAAKGYFEAHNEVKAVIRKLHEGQLSIGGLLEEVTAWYRALFGPMVRARIIRSVDLAGYRNRPVFIRGSRHVPLPAEALTDAMEVVFRCAADDIHPLTRAILCHWSIGYIHPFPDGNGRTARFLMNALLVSCGYPWTIIRVDDRAQYMQSLEALSINNDPDPFVACVLQAMSASEKLAGKS